MTPRKSNMDVASNPRGPVPDNAVPRILLAEDDADMRKLLSESLSQAGYAVEAAEDGLELMDQLSAYLGPQKKAPVDLIISDLRMPWIDGMEVLRTIGRFIGFPRMILITGFGDDAVHAEASRLGAAAIMDKPFEVDALLAQVKRILNGKPAPASMQRVNSNLRTNQEYGESS